MDYSIALGFFWWIDDSLSAHNIKASIERDSWFTENVPEARVTVSSIDLALVFTEREELSYAALITPTPGRTTTSKKVLASEIVQLEIPYSDFLAALPPSLSNPVPENARVTAWRPPNPAIWDAVWQTVIKLRPDLEDSLNELLKRRISPEIDFAAPYATNQFVQRDAIGVGLATAGIARQPIFKRIDKEEMGSDSVMKLLGESIDEDSIISYDLRRLADLELQEDRGDFCILSKNNRRVVVYNFNRKPEETKLGIDVIYWCVPYNSFTFVQYKMLENESSTWKYRPDDHFNHQVEAMTKCQSAIDLIPSNTLPDGYRLSSNAFFVKWIQRRRLVMDSNTMAKGLYVPISYYNNLVENDALKTPRGASVVSYRHLKRWLSRTEFQSLMPWGWIGTTGITMDWLRQYIDDKLEENHEVIVVENQTVPGRSPGV